jgi:hypothetical protein
MPKGHGQGYFHFDEFTFKRLDEVHQRKQNLKKRLMNKPKQISVITSYHNRPDNLLKFKESIKGIRNVDFIIIGWNQNTPFSTAKCHNDAIEHVKTEWIIKQDVDCIVPYQGFYNDIIKHLRNKPYDYFMNIGVKNYLGSKENRWGNEWVCTKEAYLEVGGEPEFTGYYGEDYAFLYKLAKLKNPNFKLEYNEENVGDVIRDELARKKNLEHSFYFLHNDHERDRDNLYADYIKNKKLLYQICKELDND